MGNYESAFAAVPGCTVEWCEYFGSYQGEMLAKITYNGETLYIQDSFGSCSGCDAFEAEFGYDAEDKPDYQERLANFGKTYVEAALPLENVIKTLETRNLTWDNEGKEMLQKLYAERPLYEASNVVNLPESNQ